MVRQPRRLDRATFILTAESLSPQGTVLDTGSITFSDSLSTVFEGYDADATTQTTHDWDQVFADATDNTDASGAHHALSFVTDPVNSSTDDTFAGGSKDINDIPTWLWTNASANAKTDIANVAGVAYVDPATGDDLLYVMMDRYDNSGEAAIGFWFFQNRSARRQAERSPAFTPLVIS